MAKGNDISKAKACILAKAQASKASSKAKVQAYGSKAKLYLFVPIQTVLLRLANSNNLGMYLRKTFGVKIPLTMACVEEKKGKRKIKIIVLSSDSSDDRKGPSKASVPIFEGPSIQGLLNHYGYNDIGEYLSWNYFTNIDKKKTNKDIIDKDITYEISFMNLTMQYPKIRQRGKERCHMEADHVPVKDQSILGYLASICKLAFAALVCSLHLQFASKHLQLAFVAYIYRFHLQVAFSIYFSLQQEFALLQATATTICYKYLLCCKLLQQALAASIC
ncbi:hypothetical protein Tco_1113175 [Tanacetum coccineum]|uniref:Uncharacterized protein n=1 Tax=Tanacetum coccineum TaxID=301880 RepID=A0ABQ5ITS5_9ASTR